ncbi:MAG: M23 family metallopeptidase [Clostridia bacterium]
MKTIYTMEERMVRKAYDSHNRGKKTSTIMYVPSNGKPSKTFRVSSPLIKFLSILMVFITIIVSQVILITFFVQENNALNQQIASIIKDNQTQFGVLNRHISRQSDLLEEKSEELEFLLDSQTYVSGSLLSMSARIENITDTYIKDLSEVTPATLSHNNLDSFLQDVAELSKALESINELSVNSNSNYLNFQAAKNNLSSYLNTIPSFWPTVSHHISSHFGRRYHPILRVYRAHDGVDLGGTTGDNIFASADGVVIQARYDSGYGYLIKIDHGEGLTTLYAHCSKFLVKEGDVVKQGQVIAKVGNTGLSSGPHLHFEVRINNVPVNPLLFIKK